MKPTHTSATCPTCQTAFDRLPLDYNEDGTGYAILEVHPCAHQTCKTLLCPCCDQFHCDGCGETFCADHLVSIPDGTDSPLHCCPTCSEGFQTEKLPLVPFLPVLVIGQLSSLPLIPKAVLANIATVEVA